jgi:hypothetical protein
MKRPCDCKDQVDADALNEQGIAINDWCMTVKPAVVEIGLRNLAVVQIPMSIMKTFAEWYMEDQSFKCDKR